MTSLRKIRTYKRFEIRRASFFHHIHPFLHISAHREDQIPNTKYIDTAMNFNNTNTNAGTTGYGNMGQQGQATGGGDVLDKGVDFLERKAGHEQVRWLSCLTSSGHNLPNLCVQSHSTTEKISDGVRKGFAKMTGKTRLSISY